MTTQPLTQEKAIEHYTELMRRVRVGAYLELEHDGSYPEDDGTPESTTLESIDNLENWAARQGLEFCYNHDTKTWSLEPIEQAGQDGIDQVESFRRILAEGGNLDDLTGPAH
jgi:hypothetical protein